VTDERRLVVLGGSTPFTVGLVDALAAEAQRLTLGELVLAGRDVEALGLSSAYARAALEPDRWRVRAETDLRSALEGARVVIHQIRSGGLEGRRHDERLAADLGLPADETLGPAGLAAAIRMASDHASVARAITDVSPDALVLNLTNPLGCSTDLLHRGGVRRVAGVCEVPLATAEASCAVMDVRIDQVDWTYAGLNHRGYVHRLRLGGRDLLAEVPERLGDGTIGGITADEIAATGAIPVKQLALLRSPPTIGASRAQRLLEVRARMLDELRADARRRPPSSVDRPQPWYADAVVPVLVASGSEIATRHVLNLPMPDGLVREVHADVSAAGIVEVQVPEPPAPIAERIERFAAHERCVVAAAREPSRATIRAAIEADPLIRSLVPDADTTPMVERVWADTLGARTPAGHTPG
jgi:6-phospho-beta-glucosidase